MACRNRHIRANTVLPPALMASVQDHVDGCYLWVPSVATSMRVVRDADIAQQRTAGLPVRDIAQATGLTERRVHQILRAHRDRDDAA